MTFPTLVPHPEKLDSFQLYQVLIISDRNLHLTNDLWDMTWQVNLRDLITSDVTLFVDPVS